MKRPKAVDKVKNQDVLNYISSLEAIVEGIEKNNNTRLFHSINKHMTAVVDKIDNISMDSEDEDISRLTKYTKQAMEIEENLSKLRDKIIPEELKELQQLDEESTEAHIFAK